METDATVNKLDVKPIWRLSYLGKGAKNILKIKNARANP